MIDFKELSDVFSEFLLNMGYLAPLLSCFLIVLEGILAFLPLFVFITVNILVLGPILGCSLSWICTSIGGFLTFYFCRQVFEKRFQKRIVKHKKIKKFMNLVNKLKFKQLVLFVAIPFLPSFFINVGAGLSKIAVKKYLYALLLGKIFIVIFWGYVGYNLVECLTNPIAFIRVVILIVIAYVIAQLISKKFDIDERF